LEGGVPPIEWPKHRSVDRPQVGLPSVFRRLHTAGPASDSSSCLKGFSQVILVDEANLVSTDYDLYFLGHFSTARAVLAQPEFVNSQRNSCRDYCASLWPLAACFSHAEAPSDEFSFSGAPKSLFGAGSLLLIELWLLLDRLSFSQSRLNALGQVLTGGPFDAGDVYIHLAVRADDELDFLHGQYFLRVITVSCVAVSNLSL
jgi:hypothetical protein